MLDHLEKGEFRFSGVSPEAISLPKTIADYVDLVVPRIGYDPAAVTSSIRDRIEAIIKSGMHAVEMSGIGRMAAVDGREPDRIVGRGIVIDSAHWSRVVSRISSPQQVVCFALTLGAEFDRIKAGAELFESFVLDGFGSEMIEQAAAGIERLLAQWYQSVELECTRRFSPGYCDWPLASGQKEIFSFLSPADIGVRALPTGAMLPSKSISAVMIAGDHVPLATPCRFCDNRKCDHRRA